MLIRPIIPNAIGTPPVPSTLVCVAAAVGEPALSRPGVRALADISSWGDGMAAGRQSRGRAHLVHRWGTRVGRDDDLDHGAALRKLGGLH
jgi:hypothetical protein